MKINAFWLAPPVLPPPQDLLKLVSSVVSNLQSSIVEEVGGKDGSQNFSAISAHITAHAFKIKKPQVIGKTSRNQPQHVFHILQSNTSTEWAGYTSCV